MWQHTCLMLGALHQQRHDALKRIAKQLLAVDRTRAYSSVRSYTIGGTTEGGSQQKALEIQAALPIYEPNQQPVSIVHKMGLQLLRDPWFNKGERQEAKH